MKHTPGLLEQNASHIFTAGKGGANICTVSSPRASDLVEYVCLDFGDPDFEEAIANAKHIVACWNACERMADPESEIAKLRQDKAHQLEALEQAQTELSRLYLYSDERPSDRVRGIIQATIAKAKP